MKQRYLFIDVNGAADSSPFLLYPNWDYVHCIVDLVKGRYINAERWLADGMEPDWQEIEEDTL